MNLEISPWPWMLCVPPKDLLPTQGDRLAALAAGDTRWGCMIKSRGGGTVVAILPITNDDCSDEAVEETIKNARVAVEAPQMLSQLEQIYTCFADFARPGWPNRSSAEGQGMLIALRGIIARATGRSEQEVQDDYGTRAHKARIAAGMDR